MLVPVTFNIPANMVDFLMNQLGTTLSDKMELRIDTDDNAAAFGKVLELLEQQRRIDIVLHSKLIN